MPILDLVVNEEFTKMYSEEELLGARRIQVRSTFAVELSVRNRYQVIRRAMYPLGMQHDPPARSNS